MEQAKRKHYVVWVGRNPGVYSSWDECRAQVDGFPGARYRSFPTREEAERAFARGIDAAATATESDASGAGPASRDGIGAAPYELDSVCVDAAAGGNPGPVEYQGVDTRTGERLFHFGPIPKGTNNLGEFLAIVHALAYLHRLGSDKTVYSDSSTAIKWVKEKRVATSLARDESTVEIWGLVDRALAWLNTHRYRNRIEKWDTDAWGEIKADFGRK